MAEERRRTAALVEAELSGALSSFYNLYQLLIFCELGLTDRQAQLLRDTQDVSVAHTIHDGFIIDLDAENNNPDSRSDGHEWQDEGEAYLCDLRETVKSRCVLILF